MAAGFQTKYSPIPIPAFGGVNTLTINAGNLFSKSIERLASTANSVDKANKKVDKLNKKQNTDAMIQSIKAVKTQKDLTTKKDSISVSSLKDTYGNDINTSKVLSALDTQSHQIVDDNIFNVEKKRQANQPKIDKFKSDILNVSKSNSNSILSNINDNKNLSNATKFSLRKLLKNQLASNRVEKQKETARLLSIENEKAARNRDTILFNQAQADRQAAEALKGTTAQQIARKRSEEIGKTSELINTWTSDFLFAKDIPIAAAEWVTKARKEHPNISETVIRAAARAGYSGHGNTYNKDTAANALLNSPAVINRNKLIAAAAAAQKKLRQ